MLSVALRVAQSDHENPELVWNAEFRTYLQDHVTSFLNLYYSSPSLTESESEQTSVADKFYVDYFSISPYPIAGNVHLPLFLKNPTFELRDPLCVVDAMALATAAAPPIATDCVSLTLVCSSATLDRFFVTCLWEEFEILIRELAHLTSSLRQTMSPDDDETAQRGFELLDIATSCLVCALQVRKLKSSCRFVRE